MRAKSISSGSDTNPRLARAERGVLCLLQGPDPTCCSRQEVLPWAPRQAELDHFFFFPLFPLFRGKKPGLRLPSQAQDLAGELHSSGVEIRYFKFVGLLFGFFFFF